jgi:putative transposase
MAEIMSLLAGLSQTVSATELRQLSVIVPAVLAMSGPITMLNLARWTGPGGSERTIRRFYNASIVWLKVNWALNRASLQEAGGLFLLAGDETVVTKAGKKTHGVSRFFSSIYRRSVPGLAFFGVSLISVAAQDSTMMLLEQLTKAESTSAQAASQGAKKSPKGAKQPAKPKGGRPPGSKNQNRCEIELPQYLQNIQGYLQQVLAVVGDKLSIPYCVLDGAFGNNHALQMVRRLDLHLVSKLAKNSALYFPYTGEQKKVGNRRKYGSKLDYQQIPNRYRTESFTQDGVRTDIYQMTLWSKAFPDPLNIVIIVRNKLATQECAHVVLFSSDLTLAYDQLILYYRLRFQIEFNFRDAKQFWGLEDFMNLKARPVYNAANFAMFMGNLATRLVRQRRKQCPDFSVNDLKADYRGRFYATEVLKLYPDLPDQGFIDALFARLSSVGAVNY